MRHKMPQKDAAEGFGVIHTYGLTAWSFSNFLQGAGFWKTGTMGGKIWCMCGAWSIVLLRAHYKFFTRRAVTFGDAF